jgi:H+/Cl- antiporter ClcA
VSAKDTPAASGRAALLRDPRLYLTALAAAGLGMLGAIFTVGFVKALEELQALLWDDLPDALGVAEDALPFLLVTCAVGGVTVGVARHRLGEYPRSLEESLADFKQDRAFDYRHIPQAVVVSLLSLGFGAALGPEAALVAVVGGIATLIGRFLTTSAARQASLTYLGLAGALGGLFSTPGAAALPIDDSYALRKPGRAWLILPGLAAAGASAWVFSKLSSGRGYFDYDYPAYDFAFVDLAWALLVAAAGTALALAFVACGRAAERLAHPLRNRPITQSTIGGVVLGLLAAASTLVLFSGHTGVQTLIDDVDASVGFLLGVAAAKVVAATVCLATGWKGGRFFPIMFAGAAVGLALAQALSALPTMVGLAAAMTAAVGGLIRKPVATALLMALVFPADLYPTVIVAALVSSALATALARRAWTSRPAPADDTPS